MKFFFFGFSMQVTLLKGAYGKVPDTEAFSAIHKMVFVCVIMYVQVGTLVKTWKGHLSTARTDNAAVNSEFA